MSMTDEWQAIALPGCEELVSDEPLSEATETAVDWSTGEVFRVHPLAAKFPMLPEDELAELAEDIKANGLAQPIVLDTERVLVDGRNRLKACELARVEPRYTEYAGDIAGNDAAAYILAVNVHRRHLTKGQRVMAAALAAVMKYDSLRAAAAALEVSHDRVHRAVVVLRHAPELADAVMAGGSLDEAYCVAQQRKERHDGDARALRRLRQEQAGLAAQVDDGSLTLAAALAAAEAIERTAAEESELIRLRQSITLAQEEIGDPVPLPAEPLDLSVRFETVPNPPLHLRESSESLKRQEAFLRRLIATRKEVEALAATPVLADVEWVEGTLNAVRSAASQIVAAAFALVEKHEAVLRGGLRKVQ